MKPLLLPTLILATATIPLAHNLNSISIILFVVACFFYQPFRQSIQKIKASRFWIVPVVYFFWIACSYFWDASGGYTNKQIERYATLLFMPLALAAVPRIKYSFIRYACAAFIAVTIAVCIICLIKSYNEYQVTRDYRVFYYHYLAQQMSLNAIFLSNFCLASLIWLFYFGRKTINIIVLIVIALFLLAMIFLLSSKMILLLLALFFPLYIVYSMRQKFNLLRVVVITVIIITGGIVAINKMPYLKWRIVETKIKKYEGVQDNNNGAAIRFFMWQTGWGMIKERPLLGWGLRGASLETLKRYEEKQFELGYKNNYHTHNQYIESTIMAGIPALLLLLLMIGLALRKGFADDNLLLIVGTLHFALHSIIESTFEVQQEQVFFLFFIFLFYYHPPKPANETGNAANNTLF